MSQVVLLEKVLQIHLKLMGTKAMYYTQISQNDQKYPFENPQNQAEVFYVIRCDCANKFLNLECDRRIIFITFGRSPYMIT